MSDNRLIEKEKGFTQLLNTYLKDTFNEEHLEIENVPGDGSCLYHAILLSFERKYGKKLEIDHKEMRRKVALHMLKFKENITYLNNYSQHENDIINISNSSKTDLRNRYVKYAEAHLNNTSHWPSELCIHIIARIYNLEIVVLQEQVIPGIGSLGYIIERLRTTGVIIHDNNRPTVPENQKPIIPEMMLEDSSDENSDGKHKEIDNNAIPASAASTTATATTAAVARSAASTTATTTTAAVASAGSATTATATTIVSCSCPFIITIGNRGDQHYYSIGTWLAGQALLIIIIIIYAFFSSLQFISTEAERVHKNGSHR